nr:F0F1 ATP synthase subunit epsilon [Pseudoalteromonas sp. TB13]
MTHVVAETSEGSYGFLPNRLDCVAPLPPGILTFNCEKDGEIFVAVDEGVLIKTGNTVLVSVRSAILGTDLATLRSAVDKEFLALNEQAQQVRTVMAKLESSFLNRFRL